MHYSKDQLNELLVPELLDVIKNLKIDVKEAATKEAYIELILKSQKPTAKKKKEVDASLFQALVKVLDIYPKTEEA